MWLKILAQNIRNHLLGIMIIHAKLSTTACMYPQVLLLLQGAEPPMLCSRQKLSRPYTEVTMMTLLTSMADRELVHMIAWAKKLPGAASGSTVAPPPTNILQYFSTAQTLPNYYIISEMIRYKYMILFVKTAITITYFFLDVFDGNLPDVEIWFS